MAGAHHHFRTLDEARQEQRAADTRTRHRIAAHLCAGDAAESGAEAADGASRAAQDAAHRLSGDVAEPIARLGEHLAGLSAALRRIGEQLADLGDLARDTHLIDLRDRFGTVPADFLADLFGPDYHPPTADPASYLGNGGR